MSTSDFITDLKNAITIYEEAINGYASRTHQLINKYGKIEALSKLVISPDLQHGFKVLRDQGKLDSTFEMVVVQHSHLFKPDIVNAAEWRLDNANNLL